MGSPLKVMVSPKNTPAPPRTTVFESPNGCRRNRAVEQLFPATLIDRAAYAGCPLQINPAGGEVEGGKAILRVPVRRVVLPPESIIQREVFLHLPVVLSICKETLLTPVDRGRQRTIAGRCRIAEQCIGERIAAGRSRCGCGELQDSDHQGETSRGSSCQTAETRRRTSERGFLSER